MTLILGGARSGKSAFAQRLATNARSVLFVATAEARDEDMRSRIEAHRRSRPTTWETLEEPLNLDATVPRAVGGRELVLVDCLTLWVSNLLLQDSEGSGHPIEKRAQALIASYRQGQASWIVVSNEVGLGVVPPTALGGRYRDVLGRVNQEFAAAADQVYLMVAGLAVDLTGLGAKPWRTLPVGLPFAVHLDVDASFEEHSR